jgi:hypothetical protein
MIRSVIPAALLFAVAFTGCESSSSVQDYSKKSSVAPHVPPNHKNAIESQHKGPNQPNPRPKNQTN